MAVNLKSEHIEFLRQYIPNIDELVANDDREGVFDAMWDVVFYGTPGDGSDPPEYVYKIEEIHDYLNEN